MSSVAALNETSAGSSWRDYLELCKARIVLMVLMTTAAGFALAPSSIEGVLLFHTLCGTALIAGGANALNQYWERERDARMVRTRERVLPDGRLTEAAALRFAIAISVAGALWLFLAVNWLASLLAVLTLVSYLFVYTPLKTRTRWSTEVGAVPGAIPPMIGWAAATGWLDLGAWILFAFMFLWQLPHFFAIGWMYRDDYTAAGFSILSVNDQTGAASARQAFLYGLGLVPLSVAPTLIGMAGPVAAIVGVLAGVVLLAMTRAFARERTRIAARNLFMASNIYLVAVMSALIVSHTLS